MTGWRRNVAIAVAAIAGLVVAAALDDGRELAVGPEHRALLRAADRGQQPRARGDRDAVGRRRRGPPAPRRPVPSARARRARPRCDRTAVPTAAPTVDDDNSGCGGGDDSSGRGRGRGRGRGGDDD